MIKTLIKFLFSTRLMAVLFLVYGAALGIGTFIETYYNTDTAKIWIYKAWWFELIMFLFVVNFIGNIKRYNLLKKENWAVFLLHASWILIIIGAGITRYISHEGKMSIREGAEQDFYTSENTFISIQVDGSYQGNALRKAYQKEVLFSEFVNNSFDWKSDFKGKEFEVTYSKFIAGAKEAFVENPQGANHLKIIESSLGNRQEHFLKEGDVLEIQNLLFSLNKPTVGAINLQITPEGSFISSPFEGTFMTMTDLEKHKVAKDSLQPLQMRSLYNLGGVQFVFPEPVVKGKMDVIKIPEKEKTMADENAVFLKISSGNETKEIAVLGRQDVINVPTSVSVNGLNFHINYGSIRMNLPFKIKLEDFIADKYPGTTNSYSSFKSKVIVSSKEETFPYEIYMNNILNYKGYRFFQANFHPDEKGSVFSVNHDFWGTLVTYIGYTLLYIGLIASMFFGKTRFVSLSKKLKEIQKNSITILAILFSFSLYAQQMLPNSQKIDSILKATMVDKEHADKFGHLVIQDDDGRMKPINTFASELLRKVSKSDTYKDMNANQAFLSMMMNGPLWYSVDFFYVKKDNDSLHKILGVDKGKKYIKPLDFFDKDLFFNKDLNYKLTPYLREAYATNTPNQFQKEFKEADMKMVLLDRALSGSILRIFPLVKSENNKWISSLEFRENPSIVQDSLYPGFINNVFNYYISSLREATQTKNYDEANAILDIIKKNQQKYGGNIMPSEKKIQAEIIYNKYDVFKKLFAWYLYVGTFMFIILIIKVFKERKILNILSNICKYLLIILFLLHTAGLIFRWYISGHAPWSDAYESMIYVAWATMAIGLYFAKRSPISLASTAFITSMILMIAHWNWLDPSIGTLQPVLNSYWLMIHVAVIVGSYGPFALGMILGIINLFLIIFTNKKNINKIKAIIKELSIVNELSLTVGLIMLTIGNFLGAQWANESWGRYWGWDPKETWALVSIMVYAFVVHMRIVPGLRGSWAFNSMSVASFASIIMTYFGVNFYLSGLHSYASGEKVITPNFVYYAVVFVILLGIISFFRYKKEYKNKS